MPFCRAAIACGFMILVAAAPPAAADQPWRQLFNGRDLDGWTPKIRGTALGDNYGDTFRVEDGVLKVVYDPAAYPTFDDKYGHLFFKEPFSRYRLRIEYRFTGEQCAGGEGWAFRNSGVMIHGEDPAGMPIEKDFPASIEVQFLGGPETGERTTANLCTPGTNVVMDGTLFTTHCTSSKSKTCRGDQWVTVEIEVDGHRKVRHLVDGEVVVRDGRSTRVDEAALREEIEGLMPLVRADIGHLHAGYVKVRPYIDEVNRRAWSMPLPIHRHVGLQRR